MTYMLAFNLKVIQKYTNLLENENSFFIFKKLEKKRLFKDQQMIVIVSLEAKDKR